MRYRATVFPMASAGGRLALRNLEPSAVQSLVTYSKLAALGRLTSGVAHEVKNPSAMRIPRALGIWARANRRSAESRRDRPEIIARSRRSGFLKFVRPERSGWRRSVDMRPRSRLSGAGARRQARITEDVAPELPPFAGDREAPAGAANLVRAIPAMPGRDGYPRRRWDGRLVEIRIADEASAFPRRISGSCSACTSRPSRKGPASGSRWCIGSRRCTTAG